jgi:hypothetical protein
MIYDLRRAAQRDGVPNHRFSSWVHRKYGRIVIWRLLHDGTLGLSLPCVLCRKALENVHIEWMAHLGDTWYSSKDSDVPKSQPTHKQKNMLGFIKTY